MNKKLNLVEILKDCPKGTKLYSTIFGEVTLDKIKEESKHPIIFITTDGNNSDVTANGRYYYQWEGECTLFPSKEQRDWSKFKPKKERFDPKTLQPFDRVICKNGLATWRCDLFSFYMEDYSYSNVCVGSSYTHCIPYNEETKHIVGTTEEAPEYYRYWED